MRIKFNFKVNLYAHDGDVVKDVTEISDIFLKPGHHNIKIHLSNSRYINYISENTVSDELYEKISDDILKNGYVDLTESGYNLGSFIYEEQ